MVCDAEHATVSWCSGRVIDCHRRGPRINPMAVQTKQYSPCHLRHMVSIDAIINVMRTKFHIVIITVSVVCMDLFDICRSVLFLLFVPVDFYCNSWAVHAPWYPSSRCSAE